MATTINELASRLRLSKGSVSRILNHKGSAFSEETRRRVFAMAEEMGYQPNPVARALATGRTGFIALWVRDLLSSYHAQVAHTMEEHLERHGYHVVVALHGKRGDPSGAYLPAGGGVDGIIAHEKYWVAPVEAAPARVPVIHTGAGCPMDGDYVRVLLSDAAVAAVQHLVEPGRRRIAYLMHDFPARREDPRYMAYHSVMAEAGLAEECLDLPAEDRASVRTAVRAYITERGCPEALFCHNDDVAIAAYRAVCDLGLRVPDDVALFGCDGIEDTEYLPVPISTIAQPFALLCETALTFLNRRLTEPDAPAQQATLQPTLLLRESSKP